MLSTCVPILRSTCSRSSLRAAKAVRAQMMSMDILLAADPDIRVIHLLRDPRAVVSSRRKMGDSIVGQYSLSPLMVFRTLLTSPAERRRSIAVLL